MFCNNCGGANPGDALFCATCGKRVARAAASEPVASEQAAQQREPVVAPSTTPPPPPQTSSALPRSAPWWIAFAAAGLAAFLLVQRGVSDSSEDTPAVAAPSAPSPDVALAPPPAPPPEPVAAIPPPAPVDPIVGRWKTSLPIGDGYLTFTADGRIHIEHVFTDEWAVYVFTDGDLMIQDQGLFDHDVTHWQAQVSGNTLSVIEPEGASHIYTRVDDGGAQPQASSESGSDAASVIADVLRELASTPSSAEAQPEPSGGRIEDFGAIVADAVNGPGAPRMQVEPAPGSLWLDVCAPISVVEKPSWRQRDSVGSTAVRAALREFLASHRFRDVGADELSAGSAERIVRVTESALDQFRVGEVFDAASECRGDYETSFRVNLAAAPSPAAAQDSAGFGDLIGEGGFIVPLQK
jgi:hypothetical protein